MKKLLSTATLMVGMLIFSGQIFAQGAAINSTGASPDNSAMLDVSSTDQGVLIPRMTEAERDAIASPATGLLIYQTDVDPCFYYYDGAAWLAVGCGFTAGGGGGAAATGAPEDCPAGFVAVNGNFCIEIDQSSDTWWNATVDCNSKDAKLCTPAEWHVACNDAGTLGLNDMTDNYEFTDGIAGNNRIEIVGTGGNCDRVDEVGPTPASNYRCCYYRHTEVSGGGGGGGGAAATYSIGDAALGGIVFYVDPSGEHGLVAAAVDQNTSVNFTNAKDEVSIHANHDAAGATYSDWRMPTKYELNLMYVAQATIGGFAATNYWSANSNLIGGDAWWQNFSSGAQNQENPATNGRARAVRSF